MVVLAVGCQAMWVGLRRLDERGVQIGRLRRVDNGGSVWGGGLIMAILTVFDQCSTGEMVSIESDKRLLASDIGSDHSLIQVWAMI